MKLLRVNNKKISIFNSGFTLIEVLITLSILAIVSAVIIPSVGKFSDSNLLNQQIENISSDIELVKFKSLSGSYSENSSENIKSDWQVVFCYDNDNTKYALQNSSTLDNSINETKIVKLASNINFTCQAPVIAKFERLSTRLPIGNGNVTATIVSANGENRTVTILENSGKIIVTSP